MKALLAFLLAGFSLLAHAQSAQPLAACGSGDLPFTVKLTDKSPEPSKPQPGKALLYFIQDGGDNSAIAYPTTRLGVDGMWIGANKESSYTALEVEPGERHLCVMVQSSFVDNFVELAHFTAEADKTYFYRTRLLLSKSSEYLELAPIDSDQGWYLVNALPRSIVKPKK